MLVDTLGLEYVLSTRKEVIFSHRASSAPPSSSWNLVMGQR